VISSTRRLCRRPFLNSAGWLNFPTTISLFANRGSMRGGATRIRGRHPRPPHLYKKPLEIVTANGIAHFGNVPEISIFSVASGTRDGPLPNHVTNTPAGPHLAHGESSVIVKAIQKDSVLSTVCAARHMIHMDGNLDGAGATMSHRAARHGDCCPECACLCVPRNAAHAAERRRRGPIFAKNVVARANYTHHSPPLASQRAAELLERFGGASQQSVYCMA
jgi:hypothetical protein